MSAIRATFVCLVAVAICRSAQAIRCHEYKSPSSGEVITPDWGATASAKATPGDNETNPFFMCFSGMATYSYAGGKQLGFAVFGGVPSDAQQWFNGVGGEIRWHLHKDVECWTHAADSFTRVAWIPQSQAMSSTLIPLHSLPSLMN